MDFNGGIRYNNEHAGLGRLRGMDKQFTVDEANELLPYLRIELKKLLEIQTDFNEKYKTLNNLNKSLVSEEAIFTMESELEFLQMEASLHITNIQKTGAMLK